MGSISVSMAPMVLADTEATPLLDGGEADGGMDENGDTEEGTFLGSKNKVTAVVTSSESDASFAAESGPSMPTRHASAAAASAAEKSGAGAYTLMAMAQQSQFMRRLFFASTSGSSPGEILLIG